jgi:hypothetical protein
MTDRWNYHNQGERTVRPWDGPRTPPVADELYDAIADLTNIRNQPWRQHAACRGVGPSLFYTEQHDMATARTTHTICQTCPVRVECGQAGETERYGIWGGHSVRYTQRNETKVADDPTSQPLPAIVHGTHGGYQQHRRQGSPPCDDCRAARNTWRQAVRAERGWRAA